MVINMQLIFLMTILALFFTNKIDFVGKGPRKFYHRISLWHRHELDFLNMVHSFWEYFQCGFSQTDNWKVRLLLWKMSPSEHDKYSNYILQRHPWDCIFAETVETLKQIFSEDTSFFNAKFNCLNITKNMTQSISHLQELLIRNVSGLKFCPLQTNSSNVWFFLWYRNICTRILSKIEQNLDMTLQKAAEECRWLVNLKHDSDMVQQSVPTTTSTIKTIQGQQYSTSPSSTHKKPPSTRWNCGGWHFARKCPFKTPHCHECNQQEHKEGFCIPLGHKTTNKRPYNKHRLKRKTHTIW